MQSDDMHVKYLKATIDSQLLGKRRNPDMSTEEVKLVGGTLKEKLYGKSNQ